MSKKKKIEILKHLNGCSNKSDFLKVNLTLVYLWVFGYVKIFNFGFECFVTSTTKAWSFIRECEDLDR